MQPFQRTAAVFDIDDSLLDGNAGTIFTWFPLLEPRDGAAGPKQVPRALYDYARKRLSEADMVALGSKCQQGIRADKLRRAGAQVLRQAHQEAHHAAGRARGAKTSVVGAPGGGGPARRRSSSTRWDASSTRTRRWARRALIKDGVASDELVPPSSSRKASASGLKEIVARHGIDVSRSYLYSDKRGRHAAARGGRAPGGVNPKPAFRAEALRRGWEVAEWKGRWKTEPDAEDRIGDEWLSWRGDYLSTVKPESAMAFSRSACFALLSS